MRYLFLKLSIHILCLFCCSVTKSYPSLWDPMPGFFAYFTVDLFLPLSYCLKEYMYFRCSLVHFVNIFQCAPFTHVHWIYFLYVQFGYSVVSDSLGPHGLQHARPPCPSPTPGAYSNSSIELVMPSRVFSSTMAQKHQFFGI